jgi:hypothetical protein
MTPAELVVVCDSNVLIPLVITASRSARLFSRLQAAGIPLRRRGQMEWRSGDVAFTVERKPGRPLRFCMPTSAATSPQKWRWGKVSTANH